MIKQTIALFVLIFLVKSATSQVRIYEGSNEEKDNSSSSGLSVLKFKTDVYEAALSGTAMFYVEKNFNDMFGIEIGAGITYLSYWNYILMGSSGSSSNGPGFGAGKPSGTTPANISGYQMPDIDDYNYKIGLAFSAFPKYYIEEDPTEGFFLGPQIAYKTFNFETPNGTNTGFLPQSLNKLNFSANIGYTWPISDNIHFESISGIGLSIVSDKRNMSYYDGISKVFDGKVDYSGTRFHFVSGIRFTVALF